MTTADVLPPAGKRLLAVPRIRPPLDHGFRPFWLVRGRASDYLRDLRDAAPVILAVERDGTTRATARTWSPQAADGDAPVAAWLAERIVKSLLWSRGGERVLVSGPGWLVEHLQRYYATDRPGRFDATMMGETIYGHPFQVSGVEPDQLPPEFLGSTEMGHHLNGCRIGFDLGASDRKVAAVIDGRVVFTEEVAWDPSHQVDPGWHVAEILESLRSAAAHLPRVDAIGGSAAGVYVNGEVRVSSLFRAVPPDLFTSRVRGIIRELRDAWRGIPFVVLNDGEVTALAGAMSFGVGSLLGLAMGSSEAGGYVSGDGRLTDWLNEVAFMPLDVSPRAAMDEWSSDRGCGAQYLSQQAVGRLLEPAGIELEHGTPLPQRLIAVQELMAAGDPRAARVYETIGVYLGYALLGYDELYEVENVLLLGRVLTGTGGDVIRERALAVLSAEAPEIARRITLHTASERDKRHGQAAAAASLPALDQR